MQAQCLNNNFNFYENTSIKFNLNFRIFYYHVSLKSLTNIHLYGLNF